MPIRIEEDSRPEGAARRLGNLHVEVGWVAVVALLTILVVGGCVQRKITIRSAPKGALVYLNDVEVGRTPVTVPFTFYGTYDVRLEKAGYKPLWTQREAEGPWWELPGPDLIAEALPGVEVEKQWFFELDQWPVAIDEAGLIERAEELRGRLDVEVGEGR